MRHYFSWIGSIQLTQEGHKSSPFQDLLNKADVSTLLFLIEFIIYFTIQYHLILTIALK
jgi:hypothetical protein